MIERSVTSVPCTLQMIERSVTSAPCTPPESLARPTNCLYLQAAAATAGKAWITSLAMNAALEAVERPVTAAAYMPPESLARSTNWSYQRAAFLDIREISPAAATAEKAGITNQTMSKTGSEKGL